MRLPADLIVMNRFGFAPARARGWPVYGSEPKWQGDCFIVLATQGSALRLCLRVRRPAPSACLPADDVHAASRTFIF
jgi:hypothetical protein